MSSSTNGVRIWELDLDQESIPTLSTLNSNCSNQKPPLTVLLLSSSSFEFPYVRISASVVVVIIIVHCYVHLAQRDNEFVEREGSVKSRK